MATFTGFLFSDAVRLAGCPRCGEEAPWYCRTPKGRKKWPPHSERIERLVAKYGHAPWERKIEFPFTKKEEP